MQLAPTKLAYSIVPSGPSLAHLVVRFENPTLSPCPRSPSVWPRPGPTRRILGLPRVARMLLIGLPGLVELDSLRGRLPSPIDLSSHHALYTHVTTWSFNAFNGDK